MKNLKKNYVSFKNHAMNKKLIHCAFIQIKFLLYEQSKIK